MINIANNKKNTNSDYVKASICIPSYNHAEFIRDAIDCALGQDFDSFEVIVSNNWSTDGTDKILESYSDKRLIKISPPYHMNMGGNWNYAVSHAKGEYVVLLSSDDKLSPDFLKEQTKILDENPGINFVFSATWKFDRSGKIIGIHKSLHGSRKISGDSAYLEYLSGPKNTLVSTLFRRSSYNKVGGFSEKYVIGLDYDFWLKLLKYGDSYYNDKSLAYYRIILDKIQGFLLHQKEKFQILEEAYSNCSDRLKKIIPAVYRKKKREIAISAIRCALEISNREESKNILLLVKKYCPEISVSLIIFLTKNKIFKFIFLNYFGLKEQLKLVIKKIVWFIS